MNGFMSRVFALIGLVGFITAELSLTASAAITATLAASVIDTTGVTTLVTGLATIAAGYGIAVISYMLILKFLNYNKTVATQRG